MKKRIIAVFLTICLLITIVSPISAAKSKTNKKPTLRETVEKNKQRKESIYKSLKKKHEASKNTPNKKSKPTQKSTLKSIGDIAPRALADLEGDGSEGNPYKIKNVKDLLSIKEDLSAYYSLSANIDLSGYYEWESLGVFTGKLNGNSYTIKGMSDEPLFKKINNGTVTGVTFEECNLLTERSGSYGVLASTIENNTQISNCNIKYLETDSFDDGDWDEGYDFFAGGDGAGHYIVFSPEADNGNLNFNYGVLVGKSADSTIKNCNVQKGDLYIIAYHLDTMPAVESSDVKISANVGGLIGEAENTTISGCKNGAETYFLSLIDDSEKTKLSQDINVGGIVGKSKSTTINASTGSSNAISNTSLIYSEKTQNNIEDISVNTGGVAGYAQDSTIENVFNTATVSFDDLYFDSANRCEDPQIYTGGIVGQAAGNTKVSKARNEAYDAYTEFGGTYAELYYIFSYTTNSTAYTGGIAGLVTDTASIENSANVGIIKSVSDSPKTAKTYSGGLIGRNTSTNPDSIKTSYNSGATLELDKNFKQGVISGGLVGANEGNFASNNYYIDSASKGVGSGSGLGKGTKLSASKMKSKSSFSGFDFTNTFEINKKNNYNFPNIKGNNFTTKFAQSIYLEPSKVTLYTGIGSKYDRMELYDIDYAVTPYSAYCDEFKLRNTNKAVANIRGEYGWSNSEYMDFEEYEDGYIKALKPGKTALTITSLDGNEVTSNKFVVTVKKGVKLNKIKLNKKKVSLKKKKTFKLKVKYFPSNATIKGVKFKSLNKKVATVSAKGVIKAKKKGKTKILITSKYNSKIKIYCTVTVK